MNKNKKGRPQNIAKRIAVKALRDKNYSFSEIGEMLQISSKLAQYFSIELSTGKAIDKENNKTII